MHECSHVSFVLSDNPEEEDEEKEEEGEDYSAEEEGEEVGKEGEVKRQLHQNRCCV